MGGLVGAIKGGRYVQVQLYRVAVMARFLCILGIIRGI